MIDEIGVGLNELKNEVVILSMNMLNFKNKEDLNK